MKKVLIALCLLGLMAAPVFGDSTKFDNVRTEVIDVVPATNGYYGYHCYLDQGRTFLIDASIVDTSTMDTWLGPADGVGVTVFIHPRSGQFRPERKDHGEEFIIQKVDSGATDIVITCVNVGTSGITAWDTTRAATDPDYCPITNTTLTMTRSSPSGVTDRLTLDAQWDYVWLRVGGPQAGSANEETSGTSFYRVDYLNN